MTIRESIQRMIGMLLARGGRLNVEHVGPRKAARITMRDVCDVCLFVTERPIAYHLASANLTLVVCLPCGGRIHNLGVDMTTRDAYIDSIGEDAAAALGVHPILLPQWFEDAIERAVKREAGHGD